MPHDEGQEPTWLWQSRPAAYKLFTQSLSRGSLFLRSWWSSLFAPASDRPVSEGNKVWSWKKEFVGVLLVFVSALILFFGRLSYPLFEPDETRYAQIALEMIASGDWITPTLEGEPYLDKPPLLYWATAASYKLFGANDWAARFPCALAMFLTVIVTYGLGRRLVGGRAACFGAATLLLCGGFILAGRYIMMDGPLTLFTTVTLFAGYLACGEKTFRFGWSIVAAAALSLGILTKGPVALILCAPPLVGLRWFSSTRPAIKIRHWLVLAAVTLLLVCPWFIAVSLSSDEFAGHFFWKHHVVRFVHAFHHRQPGWFYLPILFVSMFPVSLLAPALACFLLRKRTAELPRTPQQFGFLMLAGAWIVLFFSLSSCKLPAYILPSLPPSCLLMGGFLSHLARTKRATYPLLRNPRWIPQRSALTGVVIALAVFLANVFLFHRANPNWWLDGIILLATVALCGLCWRGTLLRERTVWGLSIGVSMIVTAFVFFDFLPNISASRSVHSQAAELQRTRNDLPVVYFKRQSYAASFYLDQTQTLNFRADQLREVGRYLKQHPRAILVTSDDGAAAIRKHLGNSIELRPAGTRGHLYDSHARWPLSARNRPQESLEDRR